MACSELSPCPALQTINPLQTTKSFNFAPYGSGSCVALALFLKYEASQQEVGACLSFDSILLGLVSELLLLGKQVLDVLVELHILPLALCKTALGLVQHLLDGCMLPLLLLKPSSTTSEQIESSEPHRRTSRGICSPQHLHLGAIIVFQRSAACFAQHAKYESVSKHMSYNSD